MGKSIIEDMVKELIVEMAKDGTAEEAAKDTGIPPNKQEVGKITYSKDGDTKFTVTDIDDETGKISWKVEKLPSYEELFNDSTELVDTAKGVRNEAKGDSVFRDIYERAKTLRNIIRTHLRNEYPDEYRRIVMRLSENDLTEQLSVSDMVNLNDKRVEAVAKAIMDKYDIPDDGRLKGIIRVALSDYLEEMSTTGGGSASFTPGTGMAYATPYAFRRPKKKQKPIPENLNEIDLKNIAKKVGGILKTAITDPLKLYPKNFQKLFDMGGDKMIRSVIKSFNDKEKGGPRKFEQLVANNEKLAKEVADKDPDGLGKDFKLLVDKSKYKELIKNDKELAKQMAEKYPATFKDIYEVITKEKIDKKNLNESINLDAYGYKLVPKNKAGNYVQKGSKLDVKQLFEDQKDFQLKRVAAFDVIEQELNDIYKMLSNAKNETSEYYNDNPSSYNVIKPTDLVLDYIKDIKDLLKGE